MILVDVDLAALLLLPIVAAVACRLRPGYTALVTVLAAVISAACLLLLPVDREVGGGGLSLAVSGFGKGALWLSLLLTASVLVANFAANVAYAIVDPRIRIGSSAA